MTDHRRQLLLLLLLVLRLLLLVLLLLLLLLLLLRGILLLLLLLRLLLVLLRRVLRLLLLLRRRHHCLGLRWRRSQDRVEGRTAWRSSSGEHVSHRRRRLHLLLLWLYLPLLYEQRVLHGRQELLLGGLLHGCMGCIGAVTGRRAVTASASYSAAVTGISR